MDLKEPLQELGIKNIFTKEADLSAMTGQNTPHRTETHTKAQKHTCTETHTESI